MGEPLRISAKTLGSLALPEFCPRCFWIQMRVRNLPYQIFPGIFSSIDSYGKNVVHGWFDRHGTSPPWLGDLGDVLGYEKPPHHSKFYTLDSETEVLLTGSPDGILVRADRSRLIIDYKTAKFTATQDHLFPMYEGQLNAYAYIGERRWKEPISGLALIYTEPVTDEATAQDDANMTPEGFRMPFRANILPVARSRGLVPDLLKRAREIFDRDSPPSPTRECDNCRLLADLLSVASD